LSDSIIFFSGIERSLVRGTGRETVIMAASVRDPVSGPMTELVTRKIGITGMTVTGLVTRTVKEIGIVKGTVKETGTVAVTGTGIVREIVIGAVIKIGNGTESGAVSHVTVKGKASSIKYDLNYPYRAYHVRDCSP
jgi:hypothetical protein